MSAHVVIFRRILPLMSAHTISGFNILYYISSRNKKVYEKYNCLLKYEIYKCTKIKVFLISKICSQMYYSNMSLSQSIQYRCKNRYKNISLQVYFKRFSQMNIFFLTLQYIPTISNSFAKNCVIRNCLFS